MRITTWCCSRAAAFAVLIMALSMLQAGCSESNGDKTGAQDRGHDAQRNGQKSPDDLTDPLLRSLGGALGDADDVEKADLDQAQGILQEADPVLTRIKEENRKALKRANSPPRRVVPKPIAPQSPESPPGNDGGASEPTSPLPAPTPQTPK